MIDFSKGYDIADSAFQINDGLNETSSCANSIAYDSKNGLVFAMYLTGGRGSYGESDGMMKLSIFPPKQPWNAHFVTVDRGIDASRGILCNAIYLTGDAKVRMLFVLNRGPQKYGYYREYDFLTDTLSERHPLYLRTDDGDRQLDFESYNAYIRNRGYSLELNDIDSEEPELAPLVRKNKPTLITSPMPPFLNRVTEYNGELYTAVVLQGITYPVLCRIEDDVLVPFAVFPYLNLFEFRYYVDETGIHAVYRVPIQDSGTGRCGYAYSPDMGAAWTVKVYEDSIQSRPDIIRYYGKPLIVYNYLSKESSRNYPPVHFHRTAIKVLYEDRVIFDTFSKFGIVEPEIISICGELYMSFSNCEQALMFLNKATWGEDGIRVENGKEKSNWIKLGIPEDLEITDRWY